MCDVYCYLWLIPVLPLLAAVFTAFFGPKYLKHNSHWPCVIAGGISCVLAFFVFLSVHSSEPPPTSHDYFTWVEVGATEADAGPKAPRPLQMSIDFSLRADPLSAIMLLTVTFIGTLIAIFAVGYMHGDPGYPRFFAAVALFLAAMTLLVSGNTFVLLFMGWEGVGVCSYLLIGFWFAKPSAAAAARKAFLVNRIGDFGFLLGIFLAWVNSGYYLDYDNIFKNVPLAGETTVTAICLLLLCGAIGKSAQVPLHVWLPDAMEGPTPVSALIHAATMVTAGVYMVARCTPLFAVSPDAQLVVAGLGALTALLAALIALTQNDLKRVLAYSTLSQLGYMFLALGSAVNGSETGVTFAVVAAIFHLFTHAFFKALLFLSAGSVMHAMGGVIDMRKFGGLRKLMPITHMTFLIGTVALAGLIPLSGFWSKDEILAATNGCTAGTPYAGTYAVFFLVGIITAGLTAFYSFRAYFRTFWGEEKIPHEAGHHAHESPRVMTVPLIILAVFAAAIGLIAGPTHWFSGGLDKTEFFPEAHEHGMNVLLMVGSTVVAAAGLGLAYLMYVKQVDLPGKVAGAIQSLYQMSLNKFYIDEIYDAFIVKPVRGFAEFCRAVDAGIVDGIVDLVGLVPRGVGALFRPVQNGLVQFYALAMLLGLTVFLIALAHGL